MTVGLSLIVSKCPPHSIHQYPYSSSEWLRSRRSSSLKERIQSGATKGMGRSCSRAMNMIELPRT